MSGFWERMCACRASKIYKKDVNVKPCEYGTSRVWQVSSYGARIVDLHPVNHLFILCAAQDS